MTDIGIKDLKKLVKLHLASNKNITDKGIKDFNRFRIFKFIS